LREAYSSLTVLLLIPDDDGDGVDARLAQLLDLPLDEHLAAHAQKPLGLLVGDGGEAGGQSRRQDDGIVHLVGSQGRDAALGGAALRDEALGGQGFHRAVDCAQGKPRGLGDLALRAMGVQHDFPQDEELVLAQTHNNDTSIRSNVHLNMFRDTITLKCSETY